MKQTVEQKLGDVDLRSSKKNCLEHFRWEEYSMRSVAAGLTRSHGRFIAMEWTFNHSRSGSHAANKFRKVKRKCMKIHTA